MKKEKNKKIIKNKKEKILINKIKNNLLKKYGIKIKKIKKIKKENKKEKTIFEKNKNKIKNAEKIIGRGHFSQISQKSGKIRTAETVLILNKNLKKQKIKKIGLKDFTQKIKRPNFNFIKNSRGNYEFYLNGKFQKNIRNKTRLKIIRKFQKKELINLLKNKFDMDYLTANKFLSSYKKEKIKELKKLKQKKVVKKIRPHLNFSLKILSDILGERIESF